MTPGRGVARRRPGGVRHGEARPLRLLRPRCSHHADDGLACCDRDPGRDDYLERSLDPALAREPLHRAVPFRARRAVADRTSFEPTSGAHPGRIPPRPRVRDRVRDEQRSDLSRYRPRPRSSIGTPIDPISSADGAKVRQVRKVVGGGDSGGDVINERIRRQVGAIRRPLFLFVNYLECHWPYAPPRRLHREVGGPRFGPAADIRYRMSLARRVGPWEAIGTADEETLAVYSALYDGEHRNVDRHLANLLGSQSAGHLRSGEAIVMVTSDHGQHIGEHGLADHQASLDDHLVRVPFVAWDPSCSDRAPDRHVRVRRRAAVAGTITGWRAPRFVPGRASLGPVHAERGLGRRRPLVRRVEGLGVGGPRSCEREAPVVRFLSARPRPRLRAQRPVQARPLRRRARTALRPRGRPRRERDVSGAHVDVAARLRTALDRRLETWRSSAEEAPALSGDQEAEIERHLTELGYA